MKALLLIAHGSRREASNDEIRVLAENLKATLGKEYPIIVAGFLELASPLIAEGLEQCAQQGASEIYVVPYFLSAGRHVQTDVPGDVQQWSEMHNHIRVHLTPYVGSSNMMYQLIEQSVQTYQTGD